MSTFETRPPTESTDAVADALAVVRWAHRWSDGAACVTASFGDATLPHLVNAAVSPAAADIR